jgi:hypothetical protein
MLGHLKCHIFSLCFSLFFFTQLRIGGLSAGLVKRLGGGGFVDIYQCVGEVFGINHMVDPVNSHLLKWTAQRRTVLKGQCHKIFNVSFLSESSFTPASNKLIGEISFFETLGISSRIFEKFKNWYYWVNQGD